MVEALSNLQYVLYTSHQQGGRPVALETEQRKRSRKIRLGLTRYRDWLLPTIFTQEKHKRGTYMGQTQCERKFKGFRPIVLASKHQREIKWRKQNIIPLQSPLSSSPSIPKHKNMTRISTTRFESISKPCMISLQHITPSFLSVFLPLSPCAAAARHSTRSTGDSCYHRGNFVPTTQNLSFQNPYNLYHKNVSI